MVAAGATESPVRDCGPPGSAGCSGRRIEVMARVTGSVYADNVAEIGPVALRVCLGPVN